jgi:hypothetical protein
MGAGIVRNGWSAARRLRAKPLVMMIAEIGGEPFFTAMAFAAMAFVFHKKHHRQP